MSVEVIEKVESPDPETLAGCPVGEVLPLVFWPDERLTRTCEEVPPDFFGEQLDKLVADMATTMYMTGGMGLSAIQVGIPYRVFICDISANVPITKKQHPNQLLTVINPAILIPPTAKSVGLLEGCLSFPGVQELVHRPDALVIRARDRGANAWTLVAGGTLARVIFHEMDHLDGKTFLDSMKPMARRSALKSVEGFHKGVKNDSIRVAPKLGEGPSKSAAKRLAVQRKKKRRERKRASY